MSQSAALIAATLQHRRSKTSGGNAHRAPPPHSGTGPAAAEERADVPRTPQNGADEPGAEGQLQPGFPTWPYAPQTSHPTGGASPGRPLPPGSAAVERPDGLACIPPPPAPDVPPGEEVDYRAAYSAMKEHLGIKLKHALEHAEHLKGKLTHAEATHAAETRARQAAEAQAGERAAQVQGLRFQLAEQDAQLVQAHASLAAAQRDGEQQRACWQAERERLLSSHRSEVAEAAKSGDAAAALAAALDEARRGGEALRVLYAEELARSSRIAVQLGRAQAELERSGPEEARLRRLLASSESRAGHAQGLAAATSAQLAQATTELQQRQQQLEARGGELDEVRALLERTRCVAVEQRTKAAALLAELRRAAAEAQSQASASARSCQDLEARCLKQQQQVEVEAAKAQTSRTHARQLLTDLEAQHAVNADLSAQLTAHAAELLAVGSDRSAAQAQVATLSRQLASANDAIDSLGQRAAALREELEARARTITELQGEAERMSGAHGELQRQVDALAPLVPQLQQAQARGAQLEALLGASQEELGECRVQLQASLDEVVALHVAGQVAGVVEAHHLQQLEELAAACSACERWEARAREVEGRLSLLDTQGAEMERLRQQLASTQSELAEAQFGWQAECTRAALLGQQQQESIARSDSLLQQLDAALSDRQNVARQRDAWMVSCQDTQGRMQVWQAVSEGQRRMMVEHQARTAAALDQLLAQLSRVSPGGRDDAAFGGGLTAAGQQVALQLACLQQLLTEDAGEVVPSDVNSSCSETNVGGSAAQALHSTSNADARGVGDPGAAGAQVHAPLLRQLHSRKRGEGHDAARSSEGHPLSSLHQQQQQDAPSSRACDDASPRQPVGVADAVDSAAGLAGRSAQDARVAAQPVDGVMGAVAHAALAQQSSLSEQAGKLAGCQDSDWLQQQQLQRAHPLSRDAVITPDGRSPAVISDVAGLGCCPQGSTAASMAGSPMTRPYVSNIASQDPRVVFAGCESQVASSGTPASCVAGSNIAAACDGFPPGRCISPAAVKASSSDGTAASSSDGTAASSSDGTSASTHASGCSSGTGSGGAGGDVAGSACTGGDGARGDGSSAASRANVAGGSSGEMRSPRSSSGRACRDNVAAAAGAARASSGKGIGASADAHCTDTQPEPGSFDSCGGDGSAARVAHHAATVLHGAAAVASHPQLPTPHTQAGPDPSMDETDAVVPVPGGDAAAAVMPGAAADLSAYVSMGAYQRQAAAMAALRAQLAETAVRAKQARAEAQAAQALMAHEQQACAARGLALARSANTLQELRAAHEALTDAHSRLVAKDLAACGMLKDKWVSDLVGRLQEAEWKLSTARRRAATWGMPLAVPSGRATRAIQTQAAELWAGVERAGIETIDGVHAGAVLSSAVAGDRSRLPGALPVGGCIAADAPGGADQPLSAASGAPELLSKAATLRMAAQCLAAKGEADVRAAHSGGAPVALAAVVMDQCRRAVGQRGAGALAARLERSVHAHAASSQDVKRFAAALWDERQQRQPGHQDTAAPPETPSPRPGVAWAELHRCSAAKRVPRHLQPQVLVPPSSHLALTSLSRQPGMAELLNWAADGQFLQPLQLAGGLDVRLSDVQAPHVHYLLLEAVDVLRLGALPPVYVHTGGTPAARLLRAPRAMVTVLGVSDPQESVMYSCQRQAVLLVSSAAMQALAPPQLQALLAAALAPMAAPGGRGWDPGSNDATSKAACWADVATLVTLLELYPDVLRRGIPGEMSVAVPRILGSLCDASGVLAAVGDRAAMLVTQSVAAAATSALLDHDASATAGADWEGSALQAVEAAAAADSAGEGATRRPWQRRLQELSAWAEGPYVELMSVSDPLRHIVQCS